MRRALAIMTAMLLLAALGCGKKAEEPKQTSAEAPSVANLPAPPEGSGAPPAMPPGMGAGAGMPGGMPPGMGEGTGMPGGMPSGMGQPAGPAKQVIVPDAVVKLYPASKILVKKKGDSGAGTTFEVAPGKSFIVPGTSLKVEVGQYLPDFAMDAATITSKSDQPNNPTVRMTVYEGDKQIYQGWAFQNMPEVHAFNHPEYSIVLAGGIKAQ